MRYRASGIVVCIILLLSYAFASTLSNTAFNDSTKSIASALGKAGGAITKATSSISKFFPRISNISIKFGTETAELLRTLKWAQKIIDASEEAAHGLARVTKALENKAGKLTELYSAIGETKYVNFSEKTERIALQVGDNSEQVFEILIPKKPYQIAIANYSEEIVAKGTKAVGKYPGAERLIQNADDIKFLGEFDDAIKNSEQAFATYPEKIIVEELPDAYSGYDKYNDIIYIGTKLDDTPINKMELKEAIIPHEHAHAKTIKELGDAENIVGEADYIYVEYFDEFSTDLQVKNILTDNSKFIEITRDNLNKITQAEIESLANTSNFDILANYKAKADIFGSPRIVSSVDNALASLGPQTQTKFNELVVLYKNYGALEGISKASYASRLNEIMVKTKEIILGVS